MKTTEFKDLLVSWMPEMEEKVKELEGTVKARGASDWSDEKTYTELYSPDTWNITRKFTLWGDGYVEFFFHARSGRKGIKAFCVWAHREGDYFQRSSPFEPAKDYPVYKSSGYKFQVSRQWG